MSVQQELGNRNNEGKTTYHLLSWKAIEEICKVYMMGAKKYGEYNWLKGLKFSNSFNSGMRHRLAWWQGEDLDKESGLNHLAHSAWNDIANLTFALEGRTHLDDRLKPLVTVQ